MALRCAVALAVVICSPARAVEAAPPEISAGPLVPGCVEAFAQLPIDAEGRGFDIDASGVARPVSGDEESLVRHFKRHRAAYEAYDKTCFARWADLQKRTRAFLGANAGSLFSPLSNGPYCSAFRIAPGLIATARHCVQPSDFRLFSEPSVAYRVHWREAVTTVPLDQPADDLDDWAIVPVDEPKPRYTWRKATFTRGVRPDQSIAVIAVSIFAYHVLGGARPETWLDAVRFSRAYGSKIFPVEDVAPPVTEPGQIAECLYHRAPTYQGMSGAPIIAVKAPATADGLPRFYVVGIHLRNGGGSGPVAGRSCGVRPAYNVGIRLPAPILAAIVEAERPAQAVATSPLP